MEPRMAACWRSFGNDLPAKKLPPPLENWMMTGELAVCAASSTAFTELELITFTAGKAKPSACASRKIAMTASPVTTPGEATEETRRAPEGRVDGCDMSEFSCGASRDLS